VFHIPVMKKEVLELLLKDPKGLYVDCTIGTGGHTEEILKSKTNQNVTVIGMDRARKRLKGYGERLRLIQGNFRDLEKHLAGRKYDGFLLDLGISSLQLADKSRGFSYMEDGPIDMAMGEDGASVKEMLSIAGQEEISRILKEFGEERRHRMIAKSIVRTRELEEIVRTRQLVDAVKEVIYPDKIYGTLSRVFQAFRIWANDELENLRVFLPQAVRLLNTGGRIAVISYHSLEDRIVKRFFVHEEKDCICPPDFPVCACDKQAKLRIITRQPVLSAPSEIEENTRARSAKLRVAERTQDE